MEEEKRYEKKVEVNEKPLSGTKRVEETEVKIGEQRSAAAAPSRSERMARKSGEIVGSGLRKVSSVVGEFASGFSKEIKPRKSPKEEAKASQTVSRSEQSEKAEEAHQIEVTEKERIEK